MRCNRPHDLVFGAADRAGGGGRHSAADGGKSNTGVGGVNRAVGPGGSNYCDYSAVVPGSGFAAARAPSHFRTRKSRPCAGDGGTVCFVLAGVALDLVAGTARILVFSCTDWWIVLLGSGIGALQALAIRHGRVQFHGMASNGSGRGELSISVGGRRFLARGMDGARGERRVVSHSLRVVDWIHRLHLAAGACAYIESVDLCVCESGGRGVSGMVDTARACRQIHCDGQCYCGFVRDSGYEREGKGDDCGRGTAGGGSGGGLIRIAEPLGGLGVRLKRYCRELHYLFSVSGSPRLTPEPR